MQSLLPRHSRALHKKTLPHILEAASSTARTARHSFTFNVMDWRLHMSGLKSLGKQATPGTEARAPGT